MVRERQVRHGRRELEGDELRRVGHPEILARTVSAGLVEEDVRAGMLGVEVGAAEEAGVAEAKAKAKPKAKPASKRTRTKKPT